MKQILKQTFETFATTLPEAEKIVADAKDKYDSNVVNEQITRKLKTTKEAELEYFLVKITVQHVTAKELLEDLI